MAYITVTLLFGKNQQMDLALPDEIPSQFLGEAIAMGLGMYSPNALFTLTLMDEKEKTLLPAASLHTARILNGAYIRLDASQIVDQGAILVSETGLRFPLKSTVTIGRNDPKNGQVWDIDLTALDPQKVTSRPQAYIFQQNGQYVVMDKDSKNGTWVNGQRLMGNQSIQLTDGDKISFGPPGKGVTMQFKVNITN